MVIGLVDETQSLVRVVLFLTPASAAASGFMACLVPRMRQPEQSLCRTDATDGSPNSLS